MADNGLIFSIFGGTGNLTYTKLMPALYQLFVEGKIDNRIQIVAIGRKKKSSNQFRIEIKEQIQKKSTVYKEYSFELFKENIHYYEMDFEKPDGFSSYKEYMDELDKNLGLNGNRLFYLATAPSFFPSISENLKYYKLLDTNGFKRAVFEKPFGYDLSSATEINNRISAVFGEENIYRIDHYLGKEMIQNILMIRFTNQIFNTVWNKDSIDNVQITVKESGGVEDRGGYYDQAGALRDMVQNHLLQILALVAMEQPKDFDTTSIRNEKVKALQSIILEPDVKSYSNIIFGQYEGYRNEEKVDKDSKTETYVAIKCEINQPRWQGVPFYLRTGKNLDGREAEVIIEFKNDKCCEKLSNTNQPNLLVIKIQPEEGIYFRINTKRPRTENELMAVSMDYCQSCNIVYRSPEAYERLINDIIIGDSTLFTRWDEVEMSWTIIKHLIESCKGKEDYIVSYKKGSEGPKEANRMIENTGRKWWNIEDITSAKFNF